MTFNYLFLLSEEAESLGDVMARAGLNTAMGLGIVFLALAFIACIIALEGKIFTAIDKAKASRKVASAASAEPEPVYEAEELSDDEELVAVITAAIYAFEAESGVAVPADGLVVRSIRRRR